MDQVFFSDITRNPNQRNDDLYNLLKVCPAIPVTTNTVQNCDYEFEHKTDKYFIPKKKSKLKVLTVRDIRNNFERAVLSDIQIELEKQQNVLLRIIKSGSSRKNQIKAVAKNILNNDNPISRSSWQMLMNINPEEQINSSQFVLWNGKCIRVNGSKGAKNKFLCNRDLSGIKKERTKNISLIKKTYSKAKGLLRNSLTVNFKPGPLTRKRELDNSYQKYNFGNIELINLPKPGLEIRSTYGTALDSTISNFILNFREVDGFISQKWAEFSVSVLGVVNGSKIKHASKSVTTFDLNYKCNQKRLLMRRDQSNWETNSNVSTSINTTMNDSVVIQLMMNQMLDAVEISINQDNSYAVEDEPRVVCSNRSIKSTNVVKDKGKRKYCELDRLDVTVIRVSENETITNNDICQNSYCALGCVCSSLQGGYKFKKHCGLIDCMFECKCGFLKYKVIDSFKNNSSELVPSLLSLDNEINFNLSKEEQKFHQTVLVDGGKSVLLKPKRRNWKTSKKYGNFYSNMLLKHDHEKKPLLTIIVTKLNCENVEPWCMVHNLYKCFCKGKFTDTSNEHMLNESDKCVLIDNKELHTEKIPNNNRYEQEKTYNTRKIKQIVKEVDDDTSLLGVIDNNVCSRIKPYEGRKYSNGYYSNVNMKIWEMESKDAYLQTRLSHLVNQSVKDNLKTYQKIITVESKTSEDNLAATQYQESENEDDMHLVSQVIESNEENISEQVSTKHKLPFGKQLLSDDANKKTDFKMIDTSTGNCISNKPKLVAWLESSYKHYKQLMAMGLARTTLEPPKKGKVALYPWDFILSRYKERKNLFLISKEQPFRIFIGVDKSCQQFKTCVSIDDIRFADLHKYPSTVKHLLTNTSEMQDNFCILYGTPICWELVGSVMKINHSNEKDTEDAASSSFSELVISDVTPSEENSNDNQMNATISKSKKKKKNIDRGMRSSSSDKDEDELIYKETTLQSESSKWFVMTVENDFSEIQFYNKGFFVKHESIIRAIKIARASGKTIRLSSQKCADKISVPQFGMYAIPTTNEECVFIGPYETDENLGIETVKTITGGRRLKRTRGVWINTNKIDNINVIDNPLSFIPLKKLSDKEMLLVESDSSELNIETNLKPQSSTKQMPNNFKFTEKSKKVVKPITIRKSNGFYQLAPPLTDTISIETAPFRKWPTLTTNPSPHVLPNTSKTASNIGLPKPLGKIPIVMQTVSHNDKISSINSITLDSLPIVVTGSEISCNTTAPLFTRRINTKKPTAEVAPQIKITAVYSEAHSSRTNENNRTERGMFILKPEEINQRINKSKIFAKTDLSSSSNNAFENNNAMDIEDFLDSSVVCSSLDDETFVISDEDEAPIKDVWIKCKNIEKLGMIRAKIDKEDCISFEFPGFKYTEFYSKDEAFSKINQVLSRKIWIPKKLDLEWCIVDSISDVESFKLLTEEELNPNTILTRNGLIPKIELKGCKIANSYGRQPGLQANKQSTSEEITTKKNSAHQFKERSELIEKHNNKLLTETKKLKEAIAKSITEASNEDREQLTYALKDIMFEAQD